MPQEKPNTIFLGPNGLRAGWSASIFVVIFLLTGFLAIYPLTWFTRKLVPNPLDYSPIFGLATELLQLISWLVAAWVMSLVEHKHILDYNYRNAPPQKTYPVRRFFFGIAWGFAAASTLILSLWKLGYLHFDPKIFTGLRSLEYAAAWGVVFLCAGFVEESLLCGYLQYTLTRGLGFWWAALILSVGFGAIHTTNPGESPIGIASAAAIGLAFCLSLWYTGSLWWAIGFHAAWDWAESYFYGTADSGIISRGRLLTAHPAGSPFFSGGTAGPEGSVFVLAVIGLLALGMHVWWGKRTQSPFTASAWKPLRINPQK